VGSCRCGAARAGGMPGGVCVGVDDQWHSGGSLLLCSVARCLGVGTCPQVDYPGMFGCMRGLVVSSRGRGSFTPGECWLLQDKKQTHTNIRLPTLSFLQPPRSPDLNTPHFYLWVHLNTLLCSTGV
jgi:hypothetical protein